jgi:hypothetical protein
MRAAPHSESSESLAAAYIVASVHSRSSDFSATGYWGRLINRLHHHWVTKAALIAASVVHTVIVLGECRSHVVLNSGDRDDNWIVNVGSGAAAQQCKRALNVRGRGAAKRALFTWDMRPSYGVVIELICIAVYLIDIALAYGSHVGGCRRAMRSMDAARDRSARFADEDEEEEGEEAELGRCAAATQRARLCGGCGFTHIRVSLVLLLLLDLLVHLVSGFRSVRFARALRPLVAAFRLRHVRSLLATLLRAWRLASIFLTLIAIEACVFGFALVVLLCGDDFVSGDDDDAGQGVVATGFAAQIYQLFLLATSPPEMLTIMQEQTSFATRALCASVLTLFQLGGKLFLYKLVIAASMRHFREEQAKTVGVQIYSRRVAHERAFAALTLTLPVTGADVTAALDASASQLRRGLIAGAEDGGASPRGGALVVPTAAEGAAEAGIAPRGAPDADARGQRDVEGPGGRGVGARAWVNVFRRVRTSEMSFSWLWLSLPLALSRVAQRPALPAWARQCARFLLGGAERTLDMWRDVAVSAFESVVGADDANDGGSDNVLPAVPIDASTEDRLKVCSLIYSFRCSYSFFTHVLFLFTLLFCFTLFFFTRRSIARRSARAATSFGASACSSTRIFGQMWSTTRRRAPRRRAASRASSSRPSAPSPSPSRSSHRSFRCISTRPRGADRRGSTSGRSSGSRCSCSSRSSPRRRCGRGARAAFFPTRSTGWSSSSSSPRRVTTQCSRFPSTR